MKAALNIEEIQKIRSETTGCASLIHFNNAGASLPPDRVVDTVIDYLKEEAMFGGYETEAKYQNQIGEVYRKIAKLINAQTGEIALFENASGAWGTAFKGMRFEQGDEIITSEMEYVTNLIGLAEIRARGIKVTVIANDEAGNFSIPQLKAAVNTKTKLIMVTHISSSGGSILPVEAIGEIAHENQIPYLLDACQSVGHLPLDVEKIKCDVLSVTGRKYLRAPRGTGFLYVRQSIQDHIKPILMDFVSAGEVSLSGYTIRGDARRYELYEKNRALTLGLGSAVDYALEIRMDRIWDRISLLSQTLRVALKHIPGITLWDHGSALSGIVTFSAENIPSTDLKFELAEQGINVSVGGQQAAPIYMEKTGQQSLLRASVHYYDTVEEIEKFVSAVNCIINQSTPLGKINIEN